MSACSLLLGLSVVLPSLIYAAAPLFVTGLLLMIAGVCFAIIEMLHALEPMELESRFVINLVEQFDEVSAELPKVAAETANGASA